ncbi:unnamed protein product [Effrenium voratum]|nr:unnamed protein product [Effrenium voratum]
MEAGMDSLSSVSLTSMLSKEFGMALSPSLVFDFPNVRALEASLSCFRSLETNGDKLIPHDRSISSRSPRVEAFYASVQRGWSCKATLFSFGLDVDAMVWGGHQSFCRFVCVMIHFFTHNWLILCDRSIHLRVAKLATLDLEKRSFETQEIQARFQCGSCWCRM